MKTFDLRKGKDEQVCGVEDIEDPSPPFKGDMDAAEPPDQGQRGEGSEVAVDEP